MSETSSTAEASENRQETDVKSDLANVFKLFDISKQNQLHPYEFQVALESLGFKSDHPLVERKISYYKNSQQRITYDDFKAFVTILMESRDKKDEMLSVFEIFDVDKTNMISLGDLKSLVASLCENIHDEELEGMIKVFDTDGDGKIPASLHRWAENR